MHHQEEDPADLRLAMLPPALTLLLAGLAAQTDPALDDSFLGDARGQWARSATASSSYGTSDYAPQQATGAPDVRRHGDYPQAWASARGDDGEQWLELGFATAVHAIEVRVRQSCQPGAIARVELLDAQGGKTTVFEGQDKTTYARGQIGWFVCRFAATKGLVSTVRLVLDTDRVAGWNEIDAVQLVADGALPPRPRFDLVRFDLPAGWTRAEDLAAARIAPPAGGVAFRIVRSEPLAGSLEEFARARLEAARANAGFQLEADVSAGAHPNGRGQIATFVYSHRPAGAAGPQYCGTILLTAGDRVAMFELCADAPAGYAAQQATFDALVQGAELTSTLQLESGKPPLSRYTVDATIDFLSWLVQAPMPEAQQQLLEAELRQTWREQRRQDIEEASRIPAAVQSLAALPASEREAARQAMLAKVLEGWRSRPDGPLVQSLLAWQAAAASAAPTAGRLPTGDTPDLFPGSTGWLPSGRGVKIPIARVVDGAPEGLWWVWQVSSNSQMDARWLIFLADGTRATSPRPGGGDLFDVDGQRQQRGTTGVGTFTVANGKITQKHDGFTSTDALAFGNDDYGAYLDIGAARHRPLSPISAASLVGTWQAAGSRYVFRADGTYELGQIVNNREFTATAGSRGTWQLDGYLLALSPSDRPGWITRIAVSEKLVLIGSGVYSRK